jgi:hypothetical protein
VTLQAAPAYEQEWNAREDCTHAVACLPDPKLPARGSKLRLAPIRLYIVPLDRRFPSLLP